MFRDVLFLDRYDIARIGRRRTRSSHALIRLYAAQNLMQTSVFARADSGHSATIIFGG